MSKLKSFPIWFILVVLFISFKSLYHPEPFTTHPPIQWRVTCPLFLTNLFDRLHSIDPRPLDLNRFFFHVLISHNCKQYITDAEKVNLKSHFILFLFFTVSGASWHASCTKV